MPEHLILRLEGPLQAWGDVALDPHRPTLPHPTCSALAGLLANAMGWRYHQAEQVTALQDALRFAVRADRPGQLLVDYQTADLEDQRKDSGWTAWGRESRGDGTQILHKQYVADGCLCVALHLGAGAPVSCEALAEALLRPERPLFLGRKCCPPSSAVLARQGVCADNPFHALLQVPAPRQCAPRLRCWCAAGDLDGRPAEVREVWDRRDFRSNRFLGARRIAETWLDVGELPMERGYPA